MPDQLPLAKKRIPCRFTGAAFSHPWFFAAVTIAAVLVLPLAGLKLGGVAISPYLTFPPAPPPVALAPFSPLLFGVAILLLGAALWFLHARGVIKSLYIPVLDTPRARLPGWGFAAIGFLFLSWIASWTRLEALRAIQPHTFTPLWLGFIFSVSAGTICITGTALVLEQPRRFALLFPVSAVFWWCYEYLNRFVQNWIYSGVEYGPLGYFLAATIPFSTVLPAVTVVSEFLAALGIFASYRNGRRVAFLFRRTFALSAVMLAVASLLLLALLPNVLYPAVWLAPLAIVFGIGVLSGREPSFSEVKEGDWRNVLTWGASACVCGFFWEMWNYFSLARWSYRIPYLGGAKIFEMPLLGYLGYIPFGWICAAASLAIIGARSWPYRNSEPVKGGSSSRLGTAEAL